MSTSSAAGQQVTGKPARSADAPGTTETASVAGSSTAGSATEPAIAVEENESPSAAQGSQATPLSTEREPAAAALEADAGVVPGEPSPRVTSRRARLSVARLDPWSVMKIAFLLSVAAGIATVVATAILWAVLSGLNVFADVERVVRDLQPVTAEPFAIMDYVGLARVVSLAVVIAVVNVILVSALSALGALLYNICSSLVGGVRMTLTDD